MMGVFGVHSTTTCLKGWILHQYAVDLSQNRVLSFWHKELSSRHI